MLFPDKDNQLASFADDRFKAAIAYSPGDISHLGDFDEAQAYQSINIPILHMTGTEDKSPLTNEGYELRLKAFQGSKDIKGKHLLVMNEADHMVFVGSRGKLGASKNREKHENIIKTFALVYWEAMLKENKSAKDWLTRDAASDWLGSEGTFE
jgi:pimeloyl-ACP methyl ester carboxylesterase